MNAGPAGVLMRVMVRGVAGKASGAALRGHLGGYYHDLIIMTSDRSLRSS